MSGGRFDYKDSNLKYEIFGLCDKPSNVFEDKEISELVWDVLDLIHDFDWYDSGDTSEETYLEAKKNSRTSGLLATGKCVSKRSLTKRLGMQKQNCIKRLDWGDEE